MRMSIPFAIRHIGGLRYLSASVGAGGGAGISLIGGCSGVPAVRVGGGAPVGGGGRGGRSEGKGETVGFLAEG